MKSLKGKEAWEELRTRLDTLDDFVLTTHINPDGDALGTEVAIKQFLSSRGKKVGIINPAPVPQTYQILDPGGFFQIFNPEIHTPDFFVNKTVFSLDNSSFSRMGRLGPVLAESNCAFMCLDHHPFEGGLPGFYYVDESVSATGELAFRLIKEMGGEVDNLMAEALFVAVLTDTGGFRFPNTTVGSFEVAAELVGKGVSPARLYDRIYEVNRPQKMRLLGLSLKDLEIFDEGKIALLTVTGSMMEETGADRSEIEGFVDMLRTINGVELGALMLELPDGHVKASLRSKWYLNVQKLAAEFGGGGHPRAAGFVTEGSLESVRESFLQKARHYLAREPSRV